MNVQKSSRHSKITGNFAESLFLYWLSKYGFECALVDHTGIDIIARNKKTKELMGISVKSRSRNTGKEGQYLSIPNETFPKVQTACKAFDCVPYIAILIDEGNKIYGFITTMRHLLKLFPKKQKTVGWKMSKKWMSQYETDLDIIRFEFEHKTLRWW